MAEIRAKNLSSLNLNVNVEFPRTGPDGNIQELVWGPLTYNSLGLATRHNADFVTNKKFADAYAYADAVPHPHHPQEDFHAEWVSHVVYWVAEQALNVPGDFVECGVRTGFHSRGIMRFLKFETLSERRFFLLDTFAEIPDDQFTDYETERGVKESYADYAEDCYDLAVSNFADYPNAVLIRGAVPQTLDQIDTDKICYLHIDMNIALPEIAAANYLWDKLSPGAMMLLDDYGWSGHELQKAAFDKFAEDRNITILSLPTGQGLIIKP